MHAQCKLSGEKGKFCFLRAFSKNVLKRQIIIFHLASGNKMSKKLLRFNREGKTVVLWDDLNVSVKKRTKNSKVPKTKHLSRPK